MGQKQFGHRLDGGLRVLLPG